MSFLESCNNPTIISSVGILAAASLTPLERACISGVISWPAVQIANAVLYGLNFYSTSQPGRFDGQQQDRYIKDADASSETLSTRKTKNEEKQSNHKEDDTDLIGYDEFQLGSRARSLVAPAGWAFVIWAPIFLGELVFCASTALLPASAPAAVLVKKASAGFMIAQIFQSLWAASFRPKYAKGNQIFVSSCMLTGIALSLNRAHRAFTSSPELTSIIPVRDYVLYFLPLTLHFGWTTAASLVNWNGSLAMVLGKGPDEEKALAYMGHASVVLATGTACAITWLRMAPMYGAVIAWALTACASTMQKRVDQMTTSLASPSTTALSKSTESAIAITTQQRNAARIQKWLCITGAVLATITSLVVVVVTRSTAASLSSSKDNN